ncbi:MAG: SRPBCC domain-containing protein [Euryarchaeota archaeon]|nr:SRPBCC domain-containing protein [Euryarchaeota archaeon]
MKELRTEIEIQASAERVWQILTDFASFPKWNPFIRRAGGEPRKGARLEVFLQPSGARGMTFRPEVLKAEPNRELRWLHTDTLRGFEEMNRALKIQAETVT